MSRSAAEGRRTKAVALFIDGLITSETAYVGGITNYIAGDINRLSIHSSAAVGRRTDGVAASTSLCSRCN